MVLGMKSMHVKLFSIVLISTAALSSTLKNYSNYTNYHNINNEYSLLEINGKFGLVDSLKTVVIPAVYEELYYLPKTQQQYHLVRNSYLNAKKRVDASSLFPYKKDGKWGYMTHNGEEKIKAKYTAASFFSSGLATVCHNGKFGYIDSLENWVIAPSLKTAFDFHGAIAPSLKEGKYGFMGKNGQVVIAHRYDSIDFKHWIYVASEGSKKTYITSNMEVFGVYDSSLSIHIYAGAFVIDSGSNYTLIRKGNLNKPIGIDEKWAHWRHEDKKLSINNGTGLLNMRTGKWTIRPFCANISYAMNEDIEIDEMEWGTEPLFYGHPIPAIYYMWRYESNQKMRSHRLNSLWYIAEKSGKYTLYTPNVSDSFPVPSHLVKKVSETTWHEFSNGLIKGSTSHGTASYHPASARFIETH